MLTHLKERDNAWEVLEGVSGLVWSRADQAVDSLKRTVAVVRLENVSIEIQIQYPMIELIVQNPCIYYFNISTNIARFPLWMSIEPFDVDTNEN